MAAQTKPDEIVALKMTDMKKCEVIKYFNVCRKTIFNVWKRFQEEQT